MFVAYNDKIFMSPHQNMIDEAIHDLLQAGLKIEDQGFPLDYVGVNIMYDKDRSILFLD